MDNSKLNSEDPYEMHALFALEFSCERCGRQLNSVSHEQFPSDEYIRALASAARTEGWFCPAQDESGQMQVMFCLCPDCVPFKMEELARLGVRS